MWQTVIDFFFTRRDTAAPDPNDSMAGTSDDGRSLTFLDLPGECRNVIYKIIFAGAKFCVTNTTVNPTWLTSYNDLDAQYFVTHALRCNRSLLLTCRTIKVEAAPLLSMASTLAVYRHYERKSPINRVPAIHLIGIRRLEVEVHTFIWVPRELLPALKEVKLTHKDSDDGQDGMLVHMLDCYSCGNERDLVVDLTLDIEDWEWKRKQFVHIAREEGFDIKLVVGVYDGTGTYFTFGIDIEQCKMKQITTNSPTGDLRSFTGLGAYRNRSGRVLDY